MFSLRRCGVSFLCFAGDGAALISKELVRTTRDASWPGLSVIMASYPIPFVLDPIVGVNASE